MDLCECHSVPVLRAKAHFVQIRVYVCGCRFVPVLRFKVTEVHFTPKIRAETKKTLKKLISYCNSRGKRCVCECVCSFRALFKGRNANWTQRASPEITVLGHTPTLSHKMMYLSADPRRRVGTKQSLERSERSGPSGKSPQAGTKICNSRPIPPPRNVRFSP